jgi:hypothetical protein
MERLAEWVADKTEKPALGFVVADKMEALLGRAVADRLGPAAVAGRMEQIGLAVGWLGLPEQVVAGKGEWMLEIVAGTTEQLGPVAVVDKKLELMESVAGTMEPLLVAADRLEELLQGPAVAGTMEQVEEVDARKMEPMEQVVGKKERPETVAGTKEHPETVVGMKEPPGPAVVGNELELLGPVDRLEL